MKMRDCPSECGTVDTYGFDSDASVPAGIVHSQHLAEGKTIVCFIVLHCFHVQVSLDR